MGFICMGIKKVRNQEYHEHPKVTKNKLPPDEVKTTPSNPSNEYRAFLAAKTIFLGVSGELHVVESPSPRPLACEVPRERNSTASDGETLEGEIAGS